MLTIAESTSRPSPIAAVALSTLYVSVAIHVCVFFSWTLAAAHMLSRGYVLHDGAGVAPRDTMVVGTGCIGCDRGRWESSWGF